MKKIIGVLILFFSFSNAIFAQDIDQRLQDEKLTQDELELALIKIKELRSLTMQNLEPADLKLTDYELAKRALKHLMSNNIKDYLQSLEGIKKDVSRTLSELLALQKYLSTNNEDILKNEYSADIKLKIPKLNTLINKKYQDALKKLLYLGGESIIPLKVKENGKRTTPIIREGSHYDMGEIDDARISAFDFGIYKLCKTRICFKKLASDIYDWHLFVRKLNQQINFIDFQGKTIWTESNVNTTPFISMAILDAAKDILQLGLKENKDYTLAGVVAKAGEDLLRLPMGAAALMLVMPTTMIEKSVKVIESVLKLKVMKVVLALKNLDLYSEKVVKEGFINEITEYTKKLDSAFYTTEEISVEQLKQNRLKNLIEVLSKYPSFPLSADEKMLTDQYQANLMNIKFGCIGLNVSDAPSEYQKEEYESACKTGKNRLEQALKIAALKNTSIIMLRTLYATDEVNGKHFKKYNDGSFDVGINWNYSISKMVERLNKIK